MYNQADLSKEIDEVITQKIEAKETVIVAWVVQAILNAHPEPDGVSEFTKFTRLETVKQAVDRRVRQHKDTAPEQLVLPGFLHLQAAYRIMRGGDPMIVPIGQMSDDELEAKAQEHMVMARGNIAHAREIRRYIRVRRETKVEAS